MAVLHPLLRVAVGLCFIGHGAFGLITKSEWLPYFALVGIEPDLAFRLMPLVGLVDILIGCTVLLRPKRAVLAYAALWCLWTAALRPLTGEGIWELLERAGNYGVPLALLLLGGATHRPWPIRQTAGLPASARAVRLRMVFRVLQWTTVLLLAGHGALLLTAKPIFVAHWAALGVASPLLPWIGAFELLLALGVAARPRVGLLVFVALWKIGTEGLWLAAGAPAWEWIERAGSYAAPIGAALLIAAGWAGRARAAPPAGPPAAPSTRHRSRRGVTASTATLFALLLAPGMLRAQLPPPDPPLLDDLRRGGLVLLCRHAVTDHAQRDANVDYSNPLTQRRLSLEGEGQAREIGRLLAVLGVPIADVYASPYHRNMRSAELSFGRVVAEHALLTGGDPERRRELLAGPVPAGGNRAIVTHQRTIHMDLPTLRRGTIDEGACVVVRPDGRGGYRGVAQALPAEWRKLLERGATEATASPPRVMRPEDLFRVETARPAAWSPDGGLVVVEITEPGGPIGPPVPSGRLWLLDVATQSLRAIPVGAGEHLGYWQPVWSPGGRHLAFLSVDDHAVVRPWIWDRRTGESLLLPDIDVRVGFNDPPIVWLDDDRAIFLAWQPAAERSGRLHARIHRSRYAQQLWQRARDGREASVTILESGGSAVQAGGARVVLVELPSGDQRVVAEGAIHRLSPSPDGRLLAYFREDPGVPGQRVSSYFEHGIADADDLYDPINWGTRLHVIDIGTGGEIVASVDLLHPGYAALSWSAGGRLAVPGTPRGEATVGAGEARSSGWIIRQDDVLAMLPGFGLDRVARSGGVWLGEDLVVRARVEGADRWDWWLMRDGAPANLTSSIPAPPSAVHSLADTALLALAGGDLWRLSAGATPVNLTAGLEPDIAALRPLDARRGIFQAQVGGQLAIVHVEDDRVRHAPIRSPHPAGFRPRAVSPAGTSALLETETAEGTQLWLAAVGSDSPGEAISVWRGNDWIHGVARGRTELIRYTDPDGGELHAWLLRPPGPEQEKPLPLVVSIYPGNVYVPGRPAPFSILETFYLNPKLYAALGYGVLVPSIPLVEQRDLIGQLEAAVLPALDTLIARGVADPARVALVGNSSGGWATLGLIGRTTRFRAAIVSAGYSNLVSLYGTFYAQHRYGDAGHPQQGQLLRMMQLERGAAPSPHEGSPWEDPDRYLHNSPLLQAQHVETPLLLIHGDMDFVPIQQAEEFFTALYRQDKRVQFLRYHGEGHALSTRANVLDVWTRIEAWLAELLAPLEGDAATLVGC
jgi:dipeptidyl aminopeptidase/acylaminoacyl peptidase/phosphohistidine phosphatase SixA